MTARHEVRVGNRRLGRGRVPPIDATPAPTVGEMLSLARERKGVDLFRAERDTKIRAKYLAALEQDEDADFPGSVYAKGFLRNYAVYLGLDPEDVADRWREQTTPARPVERPVVAPPPRPIRAPRRSFTLTPGLFVGALLALGVLAFVAWLVLQFLRFSQVPTMAVTQPSANVSQSTAEVTTIAGTSAPFANISISAPGDQVYGATADEDGNWSKEVPLAKGRNEFTVVATDPVTNKTSGEHRLIISVPLPAGTEPSGAPSGGPGSTAPPAALNPVQLAVSSPLGESAVDGGLVTVAGTTNATLVTITAAYQGPASEPAAAASPSVSPAPSPPTAPPPREVTVSGGTFSERIALPAGRWQLTINATATGMRPTSETRNVTVQMSGLTVMVIARGGSAWIQVWVDGSIARGFTAGKVLRRGESETFTAQRTIVVRTGNTGATRFFVNGQALGSLGSGAQIETWQFEPGREPRRVPGR